MFNMEWLNKSSVEVSLEVDTPVSSPTVTFRVVNPRTGDDIALTPSSGLSWPIPMTKAQGEDRWSYILPRNAMDLEVGQQIRVICDFDDGPNNSREFNLDAMVKRG